MKQLYDNVLMKRRNIAFQSHHQRDVPLTVPYYSRLGSQLQAGQTLDIHGKIREDVKRFAVNLWQGGYQMEKCTAVVLHINFRFDENKIVMNTYQNGVWGKEERVKNPLQRGEEFSLKVRVHEEKYEVSINQKEIAEYKTRIPIQLVDYLSIEGEVTLNSVYWGGRYYNLPVELAFHNGHLKNGEKMFLYGIPNGDKFNINFLSRTNDVLFHFNPRFKEKKIIRNSMINGVWGEEEREGEFPFKKDLGFDLEIQNEPYSIQIIHNGKHLMTFAHRTQDPGSDYVAFRIDGDLELTDIQFGNHE